MSGKTFNTRLVNKHDVEANWLKAVNFVPMLGEIIVYDVDDTHSYERFKIGDGKTLVSNLPFAAVKSWNDLEDKPFGETTTVKEVLWDGNTDGLTPAAEFYYKVSDEVFGVNDLIGQKAIITMADGSTNTIEIAYGMVAERDGSVMIMVEGEPYIISCGVPSEDSSEGFGVGTYFANAPDMLYVSGLICEVTTVQKMSGKYVEGMGYVELTDVVPKTAFEFPYNHDEYFGDIVPLVIGNEYRVVFDGVTYMVTCFESDRRPTIGAPYDDDIGNYDYSSYPFVVFNDYVGELGVGCKTKDSHTIAVYAETIHPIDPKFLPDEVVMESELESSIPTKTSDLTNDSGFITTADIPEGAAASTTSPKMDGTAAVGTELAFARGDHVHPSDTSRVPVTRTINGKALSSNITLSASDVNADAYGAASSAMSSAKSYTDSQVNELKNGTVTVNHATNADEANHAASADIAGEADHAVLADNATNANHATSADSATKATQDGNGKVIATTYETKADAASKLTEAKGYTDQMVGELGEGFEGVIRQMYADDITEGGAPTIREIAADEAGDALADAKSYADSKVAAIDYPVDSVNGKTGAVSLTYSDVGAAASSHGTHVTYSTTAPVMDGTASVGSAATVARSDHKHPTDTSRVPTSRTVNGKALSANITLSASDVGADASGAAATALTDAKSYTDTKISALINSAPTTLDTLGEIAAAMEDNADVVGALETAVGNKANAADLTSHVNNKSNPHGVSLSQLGVTATAAELNYMDGVTSNVQTQLNGKASSSHSHDEYVTDNFSALAVRDKGNNTVIVTASQKDDIVSIVCDDGINVVGTASKEENGDHVMGQILIEGVPAGTGYGVVKSGGDVTITNGVITVNDDSHNHTIANVDGLQTALDGKAASSHGTHVSYSTTAPVMDGTAAVGTASTVARSDHKHPSDTSRVPTTRKVNGKALSADITLSASDVSAAASSHTHGNITNAGAIGTAANKAVITTTNGVLTTGTVPVAAGGTGATTASAALANLGLTATAAELNIMDGVTATAAEINKLDGLAAKTSELNYVIGVTSNIQTQLNTKATTGYVNDQIDGVLVALESHATGHAPSNAEKNQNAFSNVTVGSTTIAADTATDTLTLVAGSNVTITPDATNDKITIAATDTKYTHPSYTAKSSGLYKVTVDATGHVSAATAVAKSDITGLGIPAQDTTYSAATTSAAGLMSAADKTKLDGIATGANKITVDTALSSTSTNPVQNKVINTALAGKAATSHTHTPESLGNGAASCSTAAATVAKVATLSGFVLTIGGMVTVNFTYAVPASATLNINNTGAKAILYKQAAITAGRIAAGDLATFIYDGSNYHLINIDRAGANPVTLSSLGVTATAAELNKLDGVTATAAELNYVDGVTSNIQTQLNAKAASTHTHAAGDITSGTLAIARGGTGLTASPSMLTNLGSTTAANVLAASPRPGVTGTLPIANGGTGATTAAAALTALGAAAADHNHANDGINPMYMEFFPGENATNGGYIDFHYANSTDDYTTRIIESQSGQLKVEGTMQVADTSNTASGARVRNIMVSTTDLTAGTSKLATGRIWFCYE